MGRQFNVVVERDSEGVYVASVPALPGCHTQAHSLDALMERIREAIELCLEEQGEPTDALDFVGVQTITVGESAPPTSPLQPESPSSVG
ncbi:MAG: type II toxin-antitoxin system HicB family antitoxin [Acidobacteriota bacterium]